MPIDPKLLAQKWVHSHEEDTADQMIFRPGSYKFPPSRGRQAFELRPDGTLLDFGIGRDDRPAFRTGSWKLDGEHTLKIVHSDARQGTSLDVEAVVPDKLVVKRNP